MSNNTYYFKYLKYKNKYLEYRNKVLSEEKNEISRILDKVEIKNYEYEKLNIEDKYKYTRYKYSEYELKTEGDGYTIQIPEIWIKLNITQEMYNNLSDELKNCYTIDVAQPQNYIFNLSCGNKHDNSSTGNPFSSVYKDIEKANNMMNTKNETKNEDVVLVKSIEEAEAVKTTIAEVAEKAIAEAEARKKTSQELNNSMNDDIKNSNNMRLQHMIKKNLIYFK